MRIYAFILAALVILFAFACGTSTNPELPKYVQVELVSFVRVWTYGHPSITGVVQNTGAATARFVKVYCRVLGVGFAVVATGEATLGTMAVGQSLPFAVIFYGLTDWWGCYPTQATDISIGWQ